MGGDLSTMTRAGRSKKERYCLSLEGKFRIPNLRSGSGEGGKKILISSRKRKEVPHSAPALDRYLLRGGGRKKKRRKISLPYLGDRP